jgi:predicted CXXCH cytochrome family protein
MIRACALKVVGLAVPAVLSCAVFAGCGDRVARYRVLSFFFDGVPVPPELAPPDANTTTQPADANSPRTATSAPAGPAEIIYHAPYKNRQCAKCHSQTASFQVPVDKDVCRACHWRHYDVPADDWVHGPVVVGKCSMCHLSHQSQHRALLPKPENNLCLDCHDSVVTLSRPFHAEARSGAKACGACHDPHSAGNRLLLADSGTYLRRAFASHVASAPHGKWTPTDCKKCHAAEKSNVVLDPNTVNKACLECHEKKVIKEVAPARLHKAVSDGKCIDCHTPHRSSLPHLVRPAAEKNCTPCHKPEKFNKPPHPPVVRADCLLCHSGHLSSREHLLRPYEAPAASQPASMPAGQAATAPATMPTGQAVKAPATMPAGGLNDRAGPARPDMPGGRP